MDNKNRINQLASELDELGIPYQKNSLFSPDDQLKFAWCNNADIVCHEFSYGNEKGLFEVMGEALMTRAELALDSVAGNITIEDAVLRIKTAYERHKESQKK